MIFVFGMYQYLYKIMYLLVMACRKRTLEGAQRNRERRAGKANVK